MAIHLLSFRHHLPPSSLPSSSPLPMSSAAKRSDISNNLLAVDKDKPRLSRPPLAQLFNADNDRDSQNSDDIQMAYNPKDLDDDKRRSIRRRSSRHDSHLSAIRRASHASSSHSFQHNDENINISVAQPLPTLQPNLYDNLATFSFGAPSATPPSLNHSSKHIIAPWEVDDPPDEDEEERVRSDRAKMRAIDDGTRRPSLPSNLTPDPAERRPSQPINVPRSNNSQQPSSAFANSSSPLSAWPHSVGSPPIMDADSPPSGQEDEETEEVNALEGFDMAYILEGAAVSPVSASTGSRTVRQNSLVNPNAHFLFPFGPGSAARRPSTASALSDGDAFVQHLRGNDHEYALRKRQWSFRKRATPAHKEVKEGLMKSQVWECHAVGKFSVARCKSSREESLDKPQPQRLIIRPHTSSSATASGAPRVLHPTSLIHKHSRANAFSIFRAAKLRTSHMSASQCVLLAPLKVQVHYTETRSTRALRTYDFLDNGTSSTTSVRSRVSSNGKSHTSSGGSTSSTGTIRDVHRELSTSPQRPRLNLSTNIPSVPAASSSAASSGPIYQHHTARMTNASAISPSPPSRSPISPLQEEDLRVIEAEEDEDDDELMEMIGKSKISPHTAWKANGKSRKVHVDAFVSAGERYQQHEPIPVPVEVARVRQSRFGTALKRAFAATPPPLPNGSSDYTVSPSNSSYDHKNGGSGPELNGSYVPPWLTLPPRAQQEKNERTLHELNKSFEDVGLLPHRKKPSHSQHSTSSTGSSNSGGFLRRTLGGSKNTAHGDAFDEVPEDSPVMLLPMWPSEEQADGQGRMTGKAASIPLQERRYLLIYYVPFMPSKENKNGAAAGSGKGDKKRSRGVTGSFDSERSGGDKEKNGDKDTVLNAFRVVAKVLSYDDVRTSGLRLPNEGIEISPPLSYGPSSPGFGYGNSFHPLPLSNFGDTMVIAVCPSPESGIEFVPEGLDKLGLCYRPTDLPISNVAEPTERERLSPVGRAIVEMAWCGCLSVMGLASTLQ